jgi:uncharacterized membrane protein YuzA (DUF378 family)
MKGMSIVSKTGLVAAVVGGVSWLIVGIWQYNFVADIFGSGTLKATTGARVVYMVFGAGAIICLPLLAAALNSARAGRWSAGEEERTRRESGAPRQAAGPGQQLVDYQEFKEFQAWRAGKRAQEPSAEAAHEESRAA